MKLQPYPFRKHRLMLGVWAVAATIALCGGSQAQTQSTGANTSDHVVVPLSHPGQPATLHVSILQGSISVKSYAGKDIVIDTANGSRDNTRENRRSRGDNADNTDTQGMKRLTTNAGFQATEDNNVVTVHSSSYTDSANYDIQVPEKTSLELSTVNGGEVVVSNIDGDISVKNVNGGINLNHVSGSIVADAMNGTVLATVDRLDSKPSSFTSLNGKLDVTLPAAVKANLVMKSDNGDVFVDDGFNLQQTQPPAGAGTTATKGRDSNGMYKVRVDRGIYGTLNGGGPEIRFQNLNGNIYVRKAK